MFIEEIDDGIQNFLLKRFVKDFVPPLSPHLVFLGSIPVGIEIINVTKTAEPI
jgi:hypothetical protein